jgi:hypothetical protein
MDGERFDRAGTHLPDPDRGNFVPRQNYRQVKKQKEQSRKARQLEKQQRRTARPNTGEIETPLQDPPANPSDPTVSRGT